VFINYCFSAAKAGKQLYFALVEYRDPKDLKNCFDHPEVLQERITNVLKSMDIKVGKQENRFEFLSIF